MLGEEVPSQCRCFPEPGEMVQPQTDVPGVMSTVRRNARFPYKTQNHKRGQFWAAWLRPQPQVLSGETCKCLRTVGLHSPIQGEPVERQEALGRVLHPTGRAQAGNLVQEGTASAWPHLRALTVKASVR